MRLFCTFLLSNEKSDFECVQNEEEWTHNTGPMTVTIKISIQCKKEVKKDQKVLC